MRTPVVAESSPESMRDPGYEAFLASIRARLAEADGPLFTTDAAGLFDAFLAALPDDQRQHYTCSTCRAFVDRYGGLVTIAPTGATASAFWDPTTAEGIYAAPVRRLAKIVGKARVTGVHLDSAPRWGQPVTRPWHHMAAIPPKARVYRDTALKNAGQAAAEKHEDYGVLQRSLADYPATAIRQAHAVLTNGLLYRSEKCIGVAAWLVALCDARDAAKGKAAKENVTWLATATAPVGYAHVRTGMIGTLLDDLTAGMDLVEVKRRFDSKMHPLAYQRPQAPPAAGNIAQAEKVIAEMQSAGSLARRFARLEDVEALWTPRAPDAPTTGGVFAHLRPKAEASRTLDLPPVAMTWEKFARTVLPTVLSMDAAVPSMGAFVALVTAANPEAPPVLQWDRPDARNPVSWYLYNGGSAAASWGLTVGWCPVAALTLLPPMWRGGGAPHQGEGAILILQGCRDLRHTAGGGFFVESLRSEYHAIRSTLEAFVRGAAIAGRDEATACGLDLRKGATWHQQVRVTTTTGRAVYTLDRWD